MAAISPVTLVTMAASSAVMRSPSGAGAGSARLLEVWRKALRRTMVVWSEKSGMGVAIRGVQMGHPAFAQGNRRLVGRRASPRRPRILRCEGWSGGILMKSLLSVMTLHMRRSVRFVWRIARNSRRPGSDLSP
jgi:hypothetical protein